MDPAEFSALRAAGSWAKRAAMWAGGGASATTAGFVA